MIVGLISWFPLAVLPLPQLVGDLTMLYITTKEKPFIYFESRFIEYMILANIMVYDSIFNVNMLIFSGISFWFFGPYAFVLIFIALLMNVADIYQYY